MHYFANYGSNYKYGFSEKDVVVCGMKRSGSTLLYNILWKMLEQRSNPNKGFFYYTGQYMEQLKNPNYFFVRKTHSYSALLKRRINKNYSLAFFTHRNLLDIIASNVEKGWIKNVNEFVENGLLDHYIGEALLYKKVKNLIFIRYDELFTNKRGVILEVAKHLNLELNELDILNIIEETSVKNTLKKIDNIGFEFTGENHVNHDTGLHENHINNPNLDKWKEVLSPEEVSLIKAQKSYEKYNRAFNY